MWDMDEAMCSIDDQTVMSQEVQPYNGPSNSSLRRIVLQKFDLRYQIQVWLFSIVFSS